MGCIVNKMPNILTNAKDINSYSEEFVEYSSSEDYGNGLESAKESSEQSSESSEEIEPEKLNYNAYRIYKYKFTESEDENIEEKENYEHRYSIRVHGPWKEIIKKRSDGTTYATREAACNSKYRYGSLPFIFSVQSNSPYECSPGCRTLFCDSFKKARRIEKELTKDGYDVIVKNIKNNCKYELNVYGPVKLIGTKMVNDKEIKQYEPAYKSKYNNKMLGKIFNVKEIYSNEGLPPDVRLLCETYERACEIKRELKADGYLISICEHEITN